MRTWLSFYIQFLSNLLMARFAEAVPGEGGKGKIPTWAIILIVIGALFVCGILCAIGVIVVLALMGPAVEDVFVEIIEEL